MPSIETIKYHQTLVIVFLVITLIICMAWGGYLLYAYNTTPRSWPFDTIVVTPDEDSELVPPPNVKDYQEPLTAEGKANKERLIKDALDRLSNPQINNRYNKTFI